jgi:hypothetical protein
VVCWYARLAVASPGWYQFPCLHECWKWSGKGLEGSGASHMILTRTESIWRQSQNWRPGTLAPACPVHSRPFDKLLMVIRMPMSRQYGNGVQPYESSTMFYISTGRGYGTWTNPISVGRDLVRAALRIIQDETGGLFDPNTFSSRSPTLLGSFSPVRTRRSAAYVGTLARSRHCK